MILFWLNLMDVPTVIYNVITSWFCWGTVNFGLYLIVIQFMYSLGLSLCSFSKLGYINTYFTSVIEMFELWLFLFWPLRCLILQFNAVLFFFHYSLMISFHQQWYIQLHTGKRFVKKAFTWMYFRNIPKVFVILP